MTSEDQIINVDPSSCKRWAFADRSEFEFGNIQELAEDIDKNGQINPVIIRKSSDPNYKYEIISGSRRWKACLAFNLPLRAILTDYDDKQAAIVQLRENERHALSSYSRGCFLAKLLKSKIIQQDQLAKDLGIGRSTLQNVICFPKIPEVVMEAIQNPERISGRSAWVIYSNAKKGEKYVEALIKIADQIRDGLASYDIDRKVKDIVSENENTLLNGSEVINKDGEVIGRWRRGYLVIRAKNSSEREKLNKLLEIFMV